MQINLIIIVYSQFQATQMTIKVLLQYNNILSLTQVVGVSSHKCHHDLKVLSTSTFYNTYLVNNNTRKRGR
jgi:hypothetical protein